MKLTQDLLNANYRILGIDSKENQSDKVVTTVKLEVKKQDDIAKIINIIKYIKCVEDVYRVGK